MISVVLFAIASSAIISAQAASFDDTDYNKKDFEFDEEIYFNMGDDFFDESNFDENGYVFPYVMGKLHKGKFIMYEEQGTGTWGGQVAYIFYENRIIERPIVQMIPQQGIILLNW